MAFDGIISRCDNLLQLFLDNQPIVLEDILKVDDFKFAKGIPFT